MTENDFVTAFAPASIGNVAVGFDMLGLAICGVGDRVSVRRIDTEGVRIAEVRGLDGEIHPLLTRKPDENTASVAAAALWKHSQEPGGLELVIRKGVPLQSGMGSSSASAVAGVLATNALLKTPLAVEELLPFALEGEKVASRALHADNVAPSLIGGLVLCPSVLLPRMVKLPTPAGLSSVVLHPELLVDTAESRKKLARGYTMEQWLTQQGYLAGFLAGIAANDIDLIRASLRDVTIEPQRLSAVPCFVAVKAAALKAGALGSSLSGSGPSLFALCENGIAAKVAVAMEQACRNCGYECQSWISPLDAPGAQIEDT
jgi:homoserine kinase